VFRAFVVHGEIDQKIKTIDPAKMIVLIA